jgi:hypothetical protein
MDVKALEAPDAITAPELIVEYILEIIRLISLYSSFLFLLKPSCRVNRDSIRTPI